MDPPPARHRASGQKKNLRSPLPAEGKRVKSNRTSLSKEILSKTSVYKTEKSGCVKGESPKSCPSSLFQLSSATHISVELYFSKGHRQKTSLLLAAVYIS